MFYCHHLVSEAGDLAPGHGRLHGAPHSGVIPGQHNPVILPPGQAVKYHVQKASKVYSLESTVSQEQPRGLPLDTEVKVGELDVGHDDALGGVTQ